MQGYLRPYSCHVHASRDRKPSSSIIMSTIVLIIMPPVLLPQKGFKIYLWPATEMSLMLPEHNKIVQQERKKELLKHMYYNIPRNLAPLRRWILCFAAPLGIVKPPRPEEGAVPDAAADDTGEAAGVEALGAEAAGAEAAGARDVAADVIIVVGAEAALLEAPAVTVTYTMSVTVTTLSSRRGSTRMRGHSRDVGDLREGWRGGRGKRSRRRG
jgi:hypothetical protein